MTVDELIKLVEGFVGHLTVKDLRTGGMAAQISELDDEEYATVVKFIAGERPEPVVTVPVGRQMYPGLTAFDYVDDGEAESIHHDASGDMEELPKTVVENGKVRRRTAAERWQAANPNTMRPVTRDPDEPLKLKGEFDGVQLP